MIYFILSPETNTIKIGYTASNVKGRLANLQTGNPVYLTLIQIIEGDLETEKQLHEEFEEYRQQGEWFYFGEKLRRYITNLNTQTLTIDTTNKKPTNKLLNIFNDECYKDKIKYDATSGDYFYQKNDELIKFDFNKLRKYIYENYNDLPSVNQIKNVLPIIAEKTITHSKDNDYTPFEMLFIEHIQDNYIEKQQPFLLNDVLKELDVKPSSYVKNASRILRQIFNLISPDMSTYNGKRARWWNNNVQNR